MFFRKKENEIDDSYKQQLSKIINQIFESNIFLKKLNEIEKVRFLEIGTADGSGSTALLYSKLNTLTKPFTLTSYEADRQLAQLAKERFNNDTRVKIEEKIYCTKLNLLKLVLPNIKTDNAELTAGHYLKFYSSLLSENNFIEQEHKVEYDFIFIDATRFMHIGIIKTFYDICGFNNPVYIIEDDIIDFGELQIILRYFEIEEIEIFESTGTSVWNFVAFKLSENGSY